MTVLSMLPYCDTIHVKVSLIFFELQAFRFWVKNIKKGHYWHLMQQGFLESTIRYFSHKCTNLGVKTK